MSSSPADSARTGATLERSMSPFSSFAISMSTICILAGGITSFHIGLCSVGGAAIGIGWPLECLFALIVATCLAHLASAFPTAGGTYHWSYTLGGRAWGWFTAFLSLAAMITALAAVNVGLCEFVIRATARVLVHDPKTVLPEIQLIAVLAITVTQAYINHRGIKLTSKLNDFSGYWIMAVAVFVTLIMLIAAVFVTGLDLGRLIEFVNNGNRPPGEDRVHDAASIPWLFFMGLLLPAYTITGFDAAAQTSEETVDAPRAVPRGIVRAVLVSGIAGWIMLSSIVLAAPDLDVAADEGKNSFFKIIRGLPYWTHSVTYIGLGVGMFLCGFAIVTSASRMAFAFARDGGLPFSPYLQRISPRSHTPSVAIWTVAALSFLCACMPTYDAIAASCAIFFYLSYVMPVGAGFFAYGKTWTRMGPWRLGKAFRPLAVVCVLGCLVLIFFGMQPRGEASRWVVGGTLAALACLWFFYKRSRFPGPPEEIRRQLLLTENSEIEIKLEKEKS